MLNYLGKYAKHGICFVSNDKLCSKAKIVFLIYQIKTLTLRVFLKLFLD